MTRPSVPVFLLATAAATSCGRAAGPATAPVVNTTSVAGTVYVDANGNGRRDAGERPLAGAVVWLRVPDGAGGYTPDKYSYPIAADHGYVFNLTAGSWQLHVVLPPGYRLSGDNPLTVQTTDGHPIAGLDFAAVATTPTTGQVAPPAAVVVTPPANPPAVPPVAPVPLPPAATSPAAGWTELRPTLLSHKVYVSASGGNDANGGLTAAAPVKTLKRAYNLVRAGTDDQVLLLRGDTWHEPFPQWRKGGAAKGHPLYVGAYGAGPRPLLLTGTASGFSLTGGPPIAHLMVRDLHFEADVRNPARGPVTPANAAIAPTGLISIIGGTDLTVEGCSFDYYACGILVQTTAQVQHDVTLRRCSVSNGYAIGWGGHPQGIFAAAVQGLVVDQCVVDHGGWLAGNPATLSGYNHGMYLQDENTDVTVTGCLVAHSSFNGIMSRCGGVIDANLVVDGCGGIIFGAANGATATLGGVRGRVTNNVVMFDHSLPTTPYGLGIEVGNTAPGANDAVSGNVVWGDTQHVGQGGISLIAATAAKSPGVGINDLTISGNDVSWDCGITLDGHLVPGGSGITGLNGLTVTGNRFAATKHAAYHPQAVVPAAESWAGNTYAAPAALARPFTLAGKDVDAAAWAAAAEPAAAVASPAAVTAAYADPTRTPDGYAQSIGLKDLDTLMSAAAAQCDTAAPWDPRLTAAAATAWIRAGFAVPAAAK